jgi:hypothetical protein
MRLGQAVTQVWKCLCGLGSKNPEQTATKLGPQPATWYRSAR